MKNGVAICTLARQLKSTAQRIEELSQDIEAFEQCDDGMVGTCLGIRMDELELAQVLVLKLTELIAEPTSEATEGETTSNQDEGGSVFGPGELTDNGGDKTQEDGTDPACSK